MPTPSVRIVILRITLIIAMVELFVMFLLATMGQDLNSSLEAVLDALILVVLSTPIIYLWVIRPYVIARDEAVAKVTYMAFHDPLTQLANRRLLTEYLQKILARLARHKHYGAILLIDLDDFKPINDQRGHDVGDAILVEIATRLKTVMRGEDIAGRLGGDEFMVLLDHLDADKTQATTYARQVAQRIQEVINVPIQLRETYQLGASIGIRILGDEQLPFDNIVKEADVAMYRAKKSGKGQTVVFA